MEALSACFTSGGMYSVEIVVKSQHQYNGQNNSKRHLCDETAFAVYLMIPHLAPTLAKSEPTHHAEVFPHGKCVPVNVVGDTMMHLVTLI